MSSWRRTVPAVMLFFIASMPVVYFQAGNLVYTQAAATNLECSGHAERNSPGNSAYAVERSPRRCDV